MSDDFYACPCGACIVGLRIQLAANPYDQIARASLDRSIEMREASPRYAKRTEAKDLLA